MQQDPTLQVAHLHWSPKSSPKDTDTPPPTPLVVTVWLAEKTMRYLCVLQC